MERIEMTTRTTKRLRRLIASTAIVAACLLALPAVADQLEETYWGMIRSRSDAQSFENYLSRFPDGAHAADARARIETLKSGEAPSTAPTVTPAPAPASPSEPANLGTATADPAALIEQTLEQAVAAQSRGDLKEAARLFGQAAEAGSALAHMQLANMMELGAGVPQDYRGALAHYEAAAALGDVGGYVAVINAKNMDYQPDSTFDPAGAARFILALSRIDLAAALSTLDRMGSATLSSLQQQMARGGFYTGKIDGQTGPGTRAALEAHARAGAAKPPSSAPSVGQPIVTGKGVGGITRDTSYDADALRAALPGYEIAVRRVTLEGVSQVSFTARKNGQDVMRIEGMDGRISHVQVTGSGIADEHGMTVGLSTFKDFTGDVEERCLVNEMRDGSSAVSCESATPAITYAFAAASPVRVDANGSVRRSSVPPQSVLVRITWYPMD
ncbi:MAG: DUF1131 family protein [Rhizobium sp.]|nr:DUF1131 family protein [Rhizobium sp.]